jgi:hypothetical protein
MVRICASIVSLSVKALPMRVCEHEPTDGEHQAAIWRHGEDIYIKLRSRKNLHGGSGAIKRCCSCRGSPQLCPIHVLWEKHLAAAVGTQPWARVSSANVLVWIRSVLHALEVCWYPSLVCSFVSAFAGQVPNAGAYGTHAFRRGHARVYPIPCASSHFGVVLLFGRICMRMAQILHKFFVRASGVARRS